MDEGTRRPDSPRRAWESKDPLVRKYAGYRASTPVSSDAPETSSRDLEPAPRPAPRQRFPSASGSRIVPDRGLRSKPFGDRDDVSALSPARLARGPHGIDPAWYARRPWKSARTRILPLVLLLGGAWIGLSLIFGTNGLVRLWELKAREKSLQAKLESVSKDHDDLQSELQEPAPLALERSAREKFDLQRPGEIVYRFPRVPAERSPQARSEETATESEATQESASGSNLATDSDARSNGESEQESSRDPKTR
jgi:cell division protein FtsB